MWDFLSSNCLDLFGYGNSITKHQVINRTLQDKLFINRISLSKSWSCRILSRIIINKKIIVMLEKGFAYCSHFKSVEPGVFASQFAWIMCLRGFMFHGVNCSSDFQFWKIFFWSLRGCNFLHESKLFALESYVSLISLHASEQFSGG